MHGLSLSPQELVLFLELLLFQHRLTRRQLQEVGGLCRRGCSFPYPLFHQVHCQRDHLVFSCFRSQCRPHCGQVSAGSFSCAHFRHHPFCKILSNIVRVLIRQILVYPPLLAFFFVFAKFVMNNFMAKIKGFSKGSRVCQSKAVTRHKRRK